VETPETKRRNYTLLEPLGSGGFGAVWRGQLVAGEGFVKSVAIKILSAEAELVDEFVQRLRDEARILALLRHRAIVQVDDLVQLDGRWAVVMEYINGADLTDLMKLGPMPEMSACGIGEEVASALHAAHTAVSPETGRPIMIVHRDIKPANIRVTPAGEVKVLDFGVARGVFDEREAQTRSLAFGSLGYLAPERFDGIDTAAVDIYALGVILYECLSGSGLGQLSVRPRLHQESVEKAIDALTVDDSFKQLLSSMISYEAEDRPDADGVARALRKAQRTAEGEWLADWAPRTLAHIQGPKAAALEPQANSESTMDLFISARGDSPDSGLLNAAHREARALSSQDTLIAAAAAGATPNLVGAALEADALEVSGTLAIAEGREFAEEEARAEDREPVQESAAEEEDAATRGPIDGEDVAEDDDQVDESIEISEFREASVSSAATSGQSIVDRDTPPVEERLPAPTPVVPPPASARPTPAAQTPAPTSAEPMPTAPVEEAPGVPPVASSGGGLKWVALIAVLLSVVGGGYAFFGPKDAAQTAPDTTDVKSPTDEAAPPNRQAAEPVATPDEAAGEDDEVTGEDDEAAGEGDEAAEGDGAEEGDEAEAAAAAAPVYRAPPASVSITGDYDAVWLVSFAGTVVSPGQLPPGSYTIHALFGEDEITGPTIDVSHGKAVAVRCNSVAQTCRVQ